MTESDLFESKPDVVSMALVSEGTRIPVDALFASLADRSSLDEILEDFPDIGRERAEAAVKNAKVGTFPRIEPSRIASTPDRSRNQT